MGFDADLAKALAAMDTAIRNGAEERMNDVVLNVTGRKPKTLGKFVDEVIGSGVGLREKRALGVCRNSAQEYIYLGMSIS